MHVLRWKNANLLLEAYQLYKWLSLFVISLVAVSYSSTANAQSCPCQNASLYGDTVETQFYQNPSIFHSATAGPGVEHPNIGGSPTDTFYRWTVDFQPQVIRMVFDTPPNNVGPSSYGANSSVTFRSLDPSLPGCTADPDIVGISVMTSKSGVPWVQTGATFTADSVTVPYGSPTGITNWDDGEFIEIRLEYGCGNGGSGGIDPPEPCCPPVTSAMLHSMFTHGGGQQYGASLEFTATFNSYMNSYFQYAKVLDPTLQFVGITFWLVDFGQTSYPIPASSVGTLTNAYEARWTGTGPPILFHNGNQLPLGAELFDGTTFNAGNGYKVVAFAYTSDTSLKEICGVMGWNFFWGSGPTSRQLGRAPSAGRSAVERIDPRTLQDLRVSGELRRLYQRRMREFDLRSRDASRERGGRR